MLKSITDCILYYFKPPLQTLANKHSDKIISTFIYMNYVAAIMHEYYAKYLKKTTRLVLPDVAAYAATCHYYLLEDKYNLYWECYENTLTPVNTTNKDAIHIIKCPEYTLCGFSENNTETPVQRSRVKFINILFSNSLLNNSLTLHLSHEFLQVGNQILSASHVLYLLATQYESHEYMFDLSYQLQVMDGGLNIHVLTSDKFLTLTDRGFIVQTL